MTQFRDTVLDRATLLSVDKKGDCMFGATGFWIFGSKYDHAKVRHMASRELRAYPRRYADAVIGPYEEYADRMTQRGEWGDHVVLQAISNASGWTWVVRSSGGPLITISPRAGFHRKSGMRIGAIVFDPVAEHYSVLSCSRDELSKADELDQLMHILMHSEAYDGTDPAAQVLTAATHRAPPRYLPMAAFRPNTPPQLVA